MEVAKAKVDQQTRSRYHARESMELVSSAGKYGAGVGTGTKREKKGTDATRWKTWNHD